MATPIDVTRAGTSKWPTSSSKIIACNTVAPRPPYSSGQCTAAQPLSANRHCHALARATRSRSSLSSSANRLMTPAPGARGVALASSHCRTSARNAASSGESSKSTRYCPAMEFTVVLYEVEGHVATITFNRPDRLNAVTFESGEQLMAAFAAAEADPEVRVIL